MVVVIGQVQPGHLSAKLSHYRQFLPRIFSNPRFFKPTLSIPEHFSLWTFSSLDTSHYRHFSPWTLPTLHIFHNGYIL